MEQGVYRGASFVGQRSSPRESRQLGRGAALAGAKLKAMTPDQIKTLALILALSVVLHVTMRVTWLWLHPMQ